jgi:hypothetical protein
MRGHLVIGRIDIRAEAASMLGDLLRAAEVVVNEPGDAVGPFGQLSIDNFWINGRRRKRRRQGTSNGGWLLTLLLTLSFRLLLLGWLLLPTFGLGFGLSPHLGDATQEFFDFVRHKLSKNQEPKIQEPKSDSAGLVVWF